MICLCQSSRRWYLHASAPANQVLMVDADALSNSKVPLSLRRHLRQTLLSYEPIFSYIHRDVACAYVYNDLLRRPCSSAYVLWFLASDRHRNALKSVINIANHFQYLSHYFRFFELFVYSKKNLIQTFAKFWFVIKNGKHNEWQTNFSFVKEWGYRILHFSFDKSNVGSKCVLKLIPFFITLEGCNAFKN